MRSLLRLVVVCFASGILTPTQTRAEEALGASIALHVTGAAGAKTPSCSGLPASPEGDPLHCLGYRITWPLFERATVYLVVVGGGIDVAGVSCGLDYDPALLRVSSWSLCADLESSIPGPEGSWPMPVSGNRIQWDPATNCQDTSVYGGTFCWGELWNVHALAGAFYVTAYGDDALEITGNTAADPDECYYIDCAGTRYDFWASPVYEGCAIGFGGGRGINCSKDMPVAVRRATWGGLKALY